MIQLLQDGGTEDGDTTRYYVVGDVRSKSRHEISEDAFVVATETGWLDGQVVCAVYTRSTMDSYYGEPWRDFEGQWMAADRQHQHAKYEQLTAAERLVFDARCASVCFSF